MPVSPVLTPSSKWVCWDLRQSWCTPGVYGNDGKRKWGIRASWESAIFHWVCKCRGQKKHAELEAEFIYLKKHMLFPVCYFTLWHSWRVLAQYLLQYGIDPVHLTVDEKTFLLTAVHLLDDSSVLCGVHDVSHRASCHLPVIGYSRLHDGLEDCKS